MAKKLKKSRSSSSGGSNGSSSSSNNASNKLKSNTTQIAKRRASVENVVIGPERGQPGIVTMSSIRYIQESRKTELEMPRLLCTCDTMTQDDAVSNSLTLTNLFVVSAMFNGGVGTGPSKSTRSQIAADFINYNLRNLEYGTWLDACQDMATDLKYGFSLLNIVAPIRTYGPYRGNRCLKKLAPRKQSSVYGWVWDKDFRDFKGFLQNRNLKQQKMYGVTGDNNWLGNLNQVNQMRQVKEGFPFIQREQLLHFTYNTTNSNPQGDTPLIHCYEAWLEKKLVERYELAGVTKNLGGIFIARVPPEIIEQANDPEHRYPEAELEYAAFQQDAADLHTGKNSFMIMTSQVDELSKKYLYDVKLLGVDGTISEVDTSAIIDQKRKSIYNLFGTSAMLLGQSNVGSNSLSTNLKSTHEYFVDNNVMQKVNVLNTQLIPRLLAINGVQLDWEDMPVFKAADPNKPDYDTLSKLAQRMGSSGTLTKEALKKVYGVLGWSEEGIDELHFDEEDSSRGSEGNGNSGFGTGESGRDDSSANSENKSRIDSNRVDNYVIDHETEDEIIAINTTTNKTIFIHKEE